MINNYIWTKSCRVIFLAKDFSKHNNKEYYRNNKVCDDIKNDYYKCIAYNLSIDKKKELEDNYHTIIPSER
jgi:hypothetical protein